MKLTIGRIAVLTFWAALLLAVPGYVRLRFPKDSEDFWRGASQPFKSIVYRIFGWDETAWFKSSDAFSLGEWFGFFVLLFMAVVVFVVAGLATIHFFHGGFFRKGKRK